MKSCLELGSGKLYSNHVVDIDFNLNVYVDRSYRHGINHSIKEIEQFHLSILQGSTSYYEGFFGGDIFEFLDSYKFKFDHIIANRVFEHMYFDSGEIGRLLDACNQITSDDATMAIIVPDFDKIIKVYQEFNDPKASSNMNSMALMINSECNNCKQDPHGSIWSKSLARYYIENEGGTWNIDSFENVERYKGRDIYMKILLSK